MAEEAPEDIIIIEDNETLDKNNKTYQEESSQDNNLKKQKIIIIGGAIVALLLIILIVVLLLLKSSHKKPQISLNSIEQKLNKKHSKPVAISKLEGMIVKANYLYTSGSKNEALHLYKKIAMYSEAISIYNLGVAQLKNKQYKLARKTFQKAIKNNEKRCVSAINAAVCSIHLQDENSFKYYINLADAYLPNEVNSPLYSYYYALIHYYNDDYLESLSALKNPSSNYYPKTQKYLSTKINALFGNNLDAIQKMENNPSGRDDFNLALLYARIGDNTLAIQHFKKSILKNIQPVKSQLALGLVELKSARVQEGANEIKNVTDMFPNKVYNFYPIKVKLKSSIFDPLKAQKHYKNIINKSKNITYQEIFYFAPYKVFNANQTISYIRKGNANIFIDNISSAKKYLKRSASSSYVNFGIAQSITKALEFKIRTANNQLQKLVKLQPKHSYKHFIRSYHLDAKNYLSGVFALMTSQLIHKESSKFESILRDSLNDEDNSEKIDLYKTLFHIAKNNYLSSINWLDNRYKQRPLYLALDIILSIKFNKIDKAKEAAKKLTILLPHDILPHMIYIDVYFNNVKSEEYAKKTTNYLKAQTLSFNDLYYGPYISRYLYIQQNLITGQLYFLRTQLEKVLDSTKEYKQEIISTLALASLYGQAFEESYTLYNQLIDDYKVRDANTLFLGSVASTAAGHHANAIALLELSKMKNTNFSESRYALGLLYLELQNNDGAVIQFSRIKENSFISQYYDFEIDTDKLLFKKQHPKQ